jgi:hypothetical protein
MSCCAVERTDEALGLTDASVRCGLASRLPELVVDIDGKRPSLEDIGGLNLCERDVLLARIRQETFGDRVESTVKCPGCGERLDVDFSLEAFVEHQKPRRSPRIEIKEGGWFQLSGDSTVFRLPTVGDLEAVEPERIAPGAGAVRALVARCVRSADGSSRFLARIERAAWKLAPQLSAELRADCAVCGQVLFVAFEVMSFVLREIQHAAARLYRDVHLLARWYHWREAEILDLPRRRRVEYVDALLADLRRT